MFYATDKILKAERSNEIEFFRKMVLEHLKATSKVFELPAEERQNIVEKYPMLTRILKDDFYQLLSELVDPFTGFLANFPMDDKFSSEKLKAAFVAHFDKKETTLFKLGILLKRELVKLAKAETENYEKNEWKDFMRYDGYKTLVDQLGFYLNLFDKFDEKCPEYDEKLPFCP